MKMARSIADEMTWLFDTSSVLHEAPLNGEFGTSFAADYTTGKGRDDALFLYAGPLLALSFDPYITASAKAILPNKNDDNQISFQWNTETDSKIGTNESEVEDDDARFAPSAQAAGLDALTATIRYLGQ